MSAADTPTVAFRVDASPAMGGGHVVRCLALAEALTEAGARCRFHVAPGTAQTVPALAAAGHEIAGETLDRHVDWLVVDHYGLDAAFETAARKHADRVMAIDDLADRPHDCDLMLDPSPSRKASDYRNLAADSSVVLAGPAFAPLRPEFARRRGAALARRDDRGPARRLLIACGSTDPADLTGKALVAAEGLDLEVTAVLGAGAPHLAATRTRLGDRLLVEPDDMAGLLAAAGLAVGAGGNSALERCCLGLPSLIAVIADNQAGNAAALAALGAARNLGPVGDLTVEALAEALGTLARDAEARLAMSQRAALVCDGLGARRVAMHLVPERARDGAPVVLRKASEADSAQMFAWQQVPALRRWARRSLSPTLPEHEVWIAGKLSDPGCLLNVIGCAGASVGVLRLDRLDDTGDGTARHEVSILVAPEAQGRGVGLAALALARRLLPEAELVAEVLPENDASHALFRSAGYRPAGGGYVSRPAARVLRAAG